MTWMLLTDGIQPVGSQEGVTLFHSNSDGCLENEACVFPRPRATGNTVSTGMRGEAFDGLQFFEAFQQLGRSEEKTRAINRW